MTKISYVRISWLPYFMSYSFGKYETVGEQKVKACTGAEDLADPISQTIGLISMNVLLILIILAPIALSGRGEIHSTIAPIHKTLSSLSPKPNHKTMARVTITCAGYKSGAQVVMRWGHPDFNNQSYFPVWTVKIGQTQIKTFAMPDKESAFQIQTEGGTTTAYTVIISVDTGNGFSSHPAILLQHKESGADIFMVSQTLTASRKSKPDKFGEQKIQVTIP